MAQDKNNGSSGSNISTPSAHEIHSNQTSSDHEERKLQNYSEEIVGTEIDLKEALKQALNNSKQPCNETYAKYGCPGRMVNSQNSNFTLVPNASAHSDDEKLGLAQKNLSKNESRNTESNIHAVHNQSNEIATNKSEKALAAKN